MIPATPWQPMLVERAGRCATIRRASETDWPRLGRLIERCYGGQGSSLARAGRRSRFRSLARSLRSPRTSAILVELEGRACAAMLFTWTARHRIHGFNLCCDDNGRNFHPFLIYLIMRYMSKNLESFYSSGSNILFFGYFLNPRAASAVVRMLQKDGVRILEEKVKLTAWERITLGAQRDAFRLCIGIGP